MNQVIAIACPPGAYGGFVSWTVERFSRIRRSLDGTITDDPVGNGDHGFPDPRDACSVEDFLGEMEGCRSDMKPWRHGTVTGWPVPTGASADDAISAALDSMAPFDRLITIEPTDPDMNYICYLRREAVPGETIPSQDVDEIADLIRSDIARKRSTPREDDPRWLRLGMGNILNYNTEPQLFDMIARHLGWPVVDKELFVDACKRMRGSQQRFFAGMMQAKQGKGSTPVQKAIHAVHTGRRG